MMSSVHFLHYFDKELKNGKYAKESYKAQGASVTIRGETRAYTVLEELKNCLERNPQVYKIYIHWNGHGSVVMEPRDSGAWMCAQNESIHIEDLMEKINAHAENVNLPKFDSPTHVHNGHPCHNCKIKAIVGKRWTCIKCPNLNLCNACHNKGHEHSMFVEDVKGI